MSAVGTTSSSCFIASRRASFALARLVSIGVFRMRASYDRIYGGGCNIQAASRTKWSRAWRKCLPNREDFGKISVALNGFMGFGVYRW